MRVMLDTNILVSLIFFPSAVTRDFARRVGFGNRIVLCDYVVEEPRLVVERKWAIGNGCSFSPFVFSD